MAKVQWSDIEKLVGDWFDQGFRPERQDLVDLAFANDASDDIVDALDTLASRPIESLEALKAQLERNGVLA